MVPMLHHDLGWKAHFDIEDDNAVDFVEFVFACFFVFTGISQARSYHLTVCDTPCGVVNKSLTSHSEVVVHNLKRIKWFIAEPYLVDKRFLSILFWATESRVEVGGDKNMKGEANYLIDYYIINNPYAFLAKISSSLS